MKEPNIEASIAWKLLKRAGAGALIGATAGIIYGGITAAIYGLPFNGATGWSGFLGGLFFPGLIVFAPGAAAIGAGLFLLRAIYKAFRGI